MVHHFCGWINFLLFQLQFEDDLRISKMFSSDGEGVPFSEEMYPRGNVEDWLLEVERIMMASLKSILHRAIVAYEQVGYIYFFYDICTLHFLTFTYFFEYLFCLID